MLLTHVQVAPNATQGSYHVQATGPAFPQGYASGDVNLKLPVRTTFIPSMRGSGRLYFQLTASEVAESLTAIVTALRAPSPAYNSGDVSAVSKRVQLAIDTAAKGEPKPTPVPSASGFVADEVTITKIVKAVLAALQQ